MVSIDLVLVFVFFFCNGGLSKGLYTVYVAIIKYSK